MPALGFDPPGSATCGLYTPDHSLLVQNTVFDMMRSQDKCTQVIRNLDSGSLKDTGITVVSIDTFMLILRSQPTVQALVPVMGILYSRTCVCFLRASSHSVLIYLPEICEAYCTLVPKYKINHTAPDTKLQQSTLSRVETLDLIHKQCMHTKLVCKPCLGIVYAQILIFLPEFLCNMLLFKSMSVMEDLQPFCFC